MNCMRCDYRLGYDCCHPANPTQVRLTAKRIMSDDPCRRDMEQWDSEPGDEYRPWTAQEDQYILDRQGWSHEVLARRLGRTPEGVECRLMWLQERSA